MNSDVKITSNYIVILVRYTKIVAFKMSSLYALKSLMFARPILNSTRFTTLD